MNCSRIGVRGWLGNVGGFPLHDALRGRDPRVTPRWDVEGIKFGANNLISSLSEKTHSQNSHFMLIFCIIYIRKMSEN